MDQRPNIERLLRQLTGDPSPSLAERAAAETQLRAVINAASDRPPRRVWWRSPAWAMGAVAVLLVILVVVPALRPSPVHAGLTELARAVGLLDSDVLQPGSYAYTRSEQSNLSILPGSDFGLDVEFVAYLLPSTREIWRDNQGTVQLRTTNHPPTFFAPETEVTYYQVGLDQLDQLDQPITITVSGATNDFDQVAWSTDPEQLHQQMLDHIYLGGSDLPDHIQVFNLARQLLTETGATPPLRAAILRVLATLDLELIQQTPDRLQIAVTHQHIRYSSTLDQTGNLISLSNTQLRPIPELGIPANTTTRQAIYQPTTTSQIP